MMNKDTQMILLDLSGVEDRTSLHQRLREELSLPSWYGNNLDALYDVLTDMTGPLNIYLIGWEKLQQADPDYFEKLFRVFGDAEKELPGCSFIFMQRYSGIVNEMKDESLEDKAPADDLAMCDAVPDETEAEDAAEAEDTASEDSFFRT